MCSNHVLPLVSYPAQLKKYGVTQSQTKFVSNYSTNKCDVDKTIHKNGWCENQTNAINTPSIGPSNAHREVRHITHDRTTPNKTMTHPPAGPHTTLHIRKGERRNPMLREDAPQHGKTGAWLPEQRWNRRHIQA